MQTGPPNSKSALNVAFTLHLIRSAQKGFGREYGSLGSVGTRQLWCTPKQLNREQPEEERNFRPVVMETCFRLLLTNDSGDLCHMTCDALFGLQ